MKFQIIVNNLTTGERMVDAETDCIIGAFHNQANDTTAQMVFSHADNIDVCITCVGAAKSLKVTLNNLAKPLKAATIDAINGMLEEQEENEDE